MMLNKTLTASTLRKSARLLAPQLSFVSPKPLPDGNISWKITPVGKLLTARGGLGAALAGTKIYTFGGDKPDPETVFAAVESFDIQSHESNSLPNLDLPVGRVDAAVVSVAGGSVYVCGGGSQHENYLRTCYECVPGGPWHKKADMPQGAVCAAGAAGPDGKVYVIGGIGVSAQQAVVLKAVQRYDPGTGSWSQVQDLHTPRFGAAAAAASGKIYVFGGVHVTDDPVNPWQVTGSAEEYDPVTNAWTVLPNEMLAPRIDLAAVTGSNGRIYAIGGMRECSAVDLVEEFNPATKTWKLMTAMPTSRYSVAAVATSDGRILVLGGWRKVSSVFLATDVIEEGILPTYAT